MRKLSAILFALALAGCGALERDTGSNVEPIFQANPAIAALIAQSREAIEREDLAEAGRKLDQARALDPDNPELWVDIARLRYRAGLHLEALASADHALSLDPQYAPALLLRAQFVRDAYGMTGSLDWFEAAVNADPTDPNALAEYAATLGDSGYFQRMLEMTRALNEIAPGHPRSFYLRAVLAARADKPVLAKSLLERSGLVQSGVPSAVLLDALIDLQERNYESAAQSLEALSLIQPENARIGELLARAYWLSGRDAQLINRFKTMAQSEHASPYLVMLVGRAIERQGDRRAAAPFLELAYIGRSRGWVRLPHQDGLPRQTRQARSFIQAQQPQTALRFLNEQSRLLPGSSDIAVLAGDAAMANRKPQEALQFYNKAALIRRPWPLTLKMAAAYRDHGDPDTADALVEQSLSAEPRNTEALLLNAERAARAKDWGRAQVFLRTALHLGAGNDPHLLKLHGITARALGREAEALHFERMTWELHPRYVPESASAAR